MKAKKSAHHAAYPPPGRAFRKGRDDGAVGLDIGTTHVVVARSEKTSQGTQLAANAFIVTSYAPGIAASLAAKQIQFLRAENQLIIFGQAALRLAAGAGIAHRKPVERGIISGSERWGIRVIDQILAARVGPPRHVGDRVCFSIPAPPLGGSASVVFHESVIKRCLQRRGYIAESINAGLAVVLSELDANHCTGIGISIGGGMCNICFAYLAVPVINYSIRKGGDYIDAMVAQAVGKPAAVIKRIKESSLDLSVEPENRIDTALRIYYDHLFKILAESLWQTFGAADDLPGIQYPFPLVLSGGTVLPKGCRGRFIAALEKVRLPISISEIIVASDPLHSTARGALAMAQTDEVAL